MPPAFSDPVDVDGEDGSCGEAYVDHAHRPVERLDVQPRPKPGMGARRMGVVINPQPATGRKACFPRRGVARQLIIILGIEVVEQWWNRHGVVLLHGEVPCGVPPSLEARPTVSGYAQNQHEILRMLRNYHAHPPTRIPVTARMCATRPRPRRDLRVWACEFARHRQGGLSPNRNKL